MEISSRAWHLRYVRFFTPDYTPKGDYTLDAETRGIIRSWLVCVKLLHQWELL